jgi:hypothetical protein
MKRRGNLWGKIISPENLALAYGKAARGKSAMRNVKKFALPKDEVRRREKPRLHQRPVLLSRRGKAFRLFSGSAVLKRQFEKYAAELPFLATVKKIGKYYTLS